MSEGIDERDLRILCFIGARQAGGEGPPSTREVARAGGFKSSRSGQVRLAKLSREGLLDVGEGEGLKRRPARVTRRGWELLGEAPMLGEVAAGRGLEPVGVGEEAYPLLAELVSSRAGKRRFLLRVVGESMLDAGIRDGDLLLVEEDPAPSDGSIVAATVTGRSGGEEATVKVLYREKVGNDGGNGSNFVRLAARSSGHEDIVVAAESVRVHGTVEWVISRGRARA